MTPEMTIESEVEFITGLGAIAARYDVVLCDVWGVLHNGLTAFASASEALMRFRSGGGTVVLITNAPRPDTAVVRQLDRLGVPRAAFDAVVTSGDLTRAAVIERRGQAVHHLGPERDRPIFEGLDVRFAGVEDADYVVCSGLFNDDLETAEDYGPLFERMLAHALPMICANPDLVVERGHRLVPCAGALALAYGQMGGEVFYAGKPHRPIYEAALARAKRLRGESGIPLARVLAVGDALRTDIAGAAAAGIPSLFVARGIHGDELGLREASLQPARMRDWLASQGARPHAAVDVLAWS